MAAGGDAWKIAELLVGLVLRWELGFEKGRQTANAWRSSSVPVLLTSNLSLGALAKKAEIGIDDAHHGRLVSVPLPDGAHGAFEDCRAKPTLWGSAAASSAASPSSISATPPAVSCAGWRSGGPGAKPDC